MRDFRRMLVCLSLAGTAACAGKPPPDPQPAPAPEPQARFEPRRELGPRHGAVPPILLRGPRRVQVYTPHNEPLYVVDGVVQEQAPPPVQDEDILDIRVVKGDEAVSRYGERGAHGVIVITTRRGAASPPR